MIKMRIFLKSLLPFYVYQQEETRQARRNSFLDEYDSFIKC